MPNAEINPYTQEQSRSTSSPRESRIIIDQVIRSAQKTIRIFEDNLDDPGYHTRARIDLLESLLLSNRSSKVLIVLHEVTNLDRTCARLMTLFRRHPDTFSIRHTLNVAKHATDALVIADEHSYWHLLHKDHPQAVFALGNGSSSVAPLLCRFDEIWGSSEPAISANVLGL